MTTMTPAAVSRLQAATGGFYFTPDGVLCNSKAPARAIFKPIPEAGMPPVPGVTPQPMIKPRSVILHSEAGPRYTPLQSLWNFIARKDITGEPHFLLDLDGKIMQPMPVTRRADNNYSANSWWSNGTRCGAVSFETADLGYPSLDVTAWNVAQLDTMVGVIAALCVTYDIACTAPPAWNATGIGHHILFPYQGVGRPAWTNVRGKTCPGRARIRQMDWIRQQVAMRVAAFHVANGSLCPAATA